MNTIHVNMNRYIICFLMSVLLVSCKKEEALEPGSETKNWFVIKDNPASPIDHAIYEVFVNTGVPVFYKDTIGTEDRINAWGQLRKYYEILRPSYSPEGSSSLYYAFVKKKEDLSPTIDFLKELLPQVPKTVYIPSILLLKNIHTTESGGTYFLAYRNYQTIAIAVDPNLATLDQMSRKKYKAAILRATVSNLIQDKDEYLSESFYAISNNVAVAVYNNVFVNTIFGTNYTKPQDLGFLSLSVSDPAKTPTMSEDLSAYIEAVFTYTTAEFGALNTTNELMLKKFKIIQKMLQDLGYSLS